jgi:hypothetical protein
MGEIMKRKLTKLIAMLLVTATLFSINVSMTITASAVESAIGDINQDGAVTIEDARLLLSYVAKITPLTEEQLALADYDNSTAVDIADVRAILKAVTVGEDFEDNLYKAGFPASYVEMLVELHNKYPEWEFKPFITGLTWEEAVNGEHTPHKKQLIEKSVDSYLKCDCEKCDGVIQEASSWVSASKAAVEYYLDPRNFLTEKYIFQFESTAYSDTHTVDGVEAILDGTWMEDSFITYFDAEGKEQTYLNENGEKVKYSNAIMTAAKDSKMSAYYLASKIVQEVGSSKASYAGGSSGKNSPYNGIYNYYNIGAYTGASDGLSWANGYLNTKRSEAKLLNAASADAEVIVTIPQNTSSIYYMGEEGDYYRVKAVVSGATYTGYVLKSSLNPSTTYGRPWDNPYKSIYYGAQYIYSSFSKYQYTGYLQKFNVNKESGSLYSHEYMANVRAAASESKHTYEAYVDAGIISSAKTFVIPVFKNMPNADATRDDVFKESVPTVKCKSCTTTEIVLSWTEVKNAEGYQIYKINASNTPEKIATVKANTLTYKDTIGTPATKAVYRIIAYTTDKTGSLITSKYKDFEATTATNAPTNLTVAKVSDNSVELTWTAVDKCQGYRVYRYDVLNGKYVVIANTTEPKFTNNTVLSGSDYKYKVRAFIKYSQYFHSGYTNEVSVKTTGDAVQKIGTVNVSDVLNVRADASTSATIIVQLKANTKVYITGETGDWYKITASVNGTTYTGYAHKDYIVVKGSSEGGKEACPYTEPTSTLRQGSTGESVKWLQWHLYKLGYLSSGDIDGDFGPTTLSAVKKYQTDKGLDVDGVVGSGTRGQLIKDYNA